MIKDILSKFPKKESDVVDEEEDILNEVQKEARCEADILADLLFKMEQRRSESTAPPEKKQKVEEKPEKPQVPVETPKEVNHGEFVQLEAKPDLSAEHVPPKCTIKVLQGLGNPYVQGTLPLGVKFRGFNSRSRSFVPANGDGSSSPSGSKRTVLTEAQAKSQVLAFLWDWWNQEGSKPKGKK